MEEAIGFMARFVGYVVFELFLYWTARIALPLVSFGKLRAGAFHQSWAWVPLTRRDSDGTRRIAPELAGVVGLLIWIGIAIAVFAIV